MLIEFSVGNYRSFKEAVTFSDLYSLVEYNIPNDAPFEQDYIAGRYGAIPFIGDLNRVLSR